MQRTPTGVIRKIVVGHNPKDEGMAFQVGGRFGNKIVTDIVEDINHFYIFGRVRFLVYVEVENEKGGAILWKGLEGVPVTIEYDLSKRDLIV